MKIRVINIQTKCVPTHVGAIIIEGTRFDAVYEVDKWSWRKFKVVSQTKQAYKLPWQNIYRDSETGDHVSRDIDNHLDAFYSLIQSKV